MRSEKVDTRALLGGRPGDANLTNPAVRMAERTKVLDYWPDELIAQIRDGIVVAPPWRLLLDPTSWGDVPAEDVHRYVRTSLNAGRWPSIDGLRRRFGRVSNHRGPDENKLQESFL